MDITTSKKKEEFIRREKMFLRNALVVESNIDDSNKNNNRCFVQPQPNEPNLNTETSKIITRIRTRTRRSRSSANTDNMARRQRVSLKACCSAVSASIQLLFCSLLIIGAPPVASARLRERSTTTTTTTTAGEFNQYHEISVQPGAQVRIECRLPVPGEAALEHHYWNFQQELPDASPKSYVLAFEAKSVPDSSLGHQLEMDLGTGAYDISINNVSTNNNGLYKCDYKTNKESIQKEIRLTVLIPPQPPSIQTNSPAPAREGLEYQVSCLSQGGNPEPNITWFRNDQQIVAGGSVRIEQTRSNGTTNSTLILVPTMEDHRSSYRCSVWNKAMNSLNVLPHERETTLNVEYAPRVTVGPSNSLKVLIGASVTLQCLVDANPPVKGIRWYKDSHLISNQYNHSINEVKISDSSIYSCQADNGIPQLYGSNQNGQVVGPATSFFSLFGLAQNSDKSPSAVEAALQLQVLYPPRVQVRPSKSNPLNENDFLSLNCSVDASPPAHEYIWTKSDDPTFRRNSPFLEFQSVAASDIGNYTCTAYNRMEPNVANAYNEQPAVIERHASGSALVLVNHKPGVAELFAGQNGRAELGQKSQLHCRAKPIGYPEPEYKFYKILLQATGGQRLALTKSTPTSSYTFMAARAEDEGRYSCLAQNVYGTSSEGEAELIVNEVPTIIRDYAARPAEDSRPVGERGFSLTVRANGKPKPEVTWFHRSPVDGRRIELSSMNERFMIETKAQPLNGASKYHVISTLTFKTPLEVDDRGLYSAEFTNGLSQSAVDEFQLHISHSPIPAAPNQPVVDNGNDKAQLKAGFNRGETVNLVCRVSAHPKPLFLWYSGSSREDDKPIEGQRYRISVTNPKDDIWESTLSFTDAQRDDYGQYLCSVANTDPQTNQLGKSIKILIHLSEKTTPDPPSQLEAIDANQDSITLQWVPGFDGGHPQVQYLVQYAPDDGSGASLSKRFPNSDTKYAIAMATSAYYPANVLDNIDLVGQSQQQQQQQQQQQHVAVSQTGKAFPKLFDCLSMNPCTIGNLLQRQTYVFRLFAKNELGPSEFSDELRASTRTNSGQIPKIATAWFDPNENVLHFRIESGTDYPLNTLNARIETRPSSLGLLPQPSNSIDNAPQQPADEMYSSGSQQQQQQQQQQVNNAGWRFNATVAIIQEKAEVHMAIPADNEIRLTLCSRNNESNCGPEHQVSVKHAASLFLEVQRGSSIYILLSTLTIIVCLAALATGVHSCCLSKKAKKADTIERVDGSIDNKPISNGAANGSLPVHKSSHGSTTSTNSTSANGASTNGLQSMDSINGVLNAGTTSDHSSDHSRQAKLDSMLPPNYNHYADRASILMEQQQQQQQQQHMMMQQHQVALMNGDKLAPSFGLPNSALLSVADQQGLSQHHSPGATLMDGANGLNYFTYQSQLEAQQQQQQQQQQHQSLDNSMMLGAAALEAPDVVSQQQQQQAAAMWTNQLDDYNTYNALGYGNQGQEQMIDPAYGTTGAVMMSPHSAAYDNSANSGQFQSYMNAYQSSQVVDTPTSAAQYQQQRAQYQAELAVAQQQMYGTLTRSGYSASGSNNANDINKSQQSTSQLDQQQQQQYNTSNGLNSASQLTPLGQQQQQQPPPPPPQESDYGTIGGRNGRLIREIIV